MDKRYDHEKFEQDIRQKWEHEKTYAPANDTAKKTYSIDTPPPTISGSLHIGSVFSYTQTDIIARYKRMSGFRVLYPFGFDDNGLPTERYVEKKRKIRAFALPREEFKAICAEEIEAARENFKRMWQQIGLSVSWDHTYSTNSDHVRCISQASFIKLFKSGHIYRRQEPAPYCTTCRTSVAQAELDDKEGSTFFSDVIFKDETGGDLVIGTTRPELLPACVALLFHPSDERYRHLRSKKATVPLFDYQVPILEDDQVDPEKGTGLVMFCTFGDKTDVAWFKKLGLPARQAVGRDGKWTEVTGALAGMKALEARAYVLDELGKKGLLPRQKEIVHNVNVHERCKSEIEYMVLSQWFVRIMDDKDQYIALADKMDWYPSFMKSRYTNWVENIGWDWCISRQRIFGIPFPVWHCLDCDEVILADEDLLPIDPQEVAPPTTCPKCGCSNIEPDTDIMDTWNTSSLTPYLCASLFGDTERPLDDEYTKTFIPMTMRAQAHDIIRTWTFDTVVKVWMHSKTVPWRDVVISGHALSEARGKISKSKGNDTTTPDALMKRFPVDAIRYWTASGSLGHDVSFSENQVKVGQRLVTKMWNAFRFTKEHIESADLSEMPRSFGMVNEWLLHQVSACFEQYTQQLDKNEFGYALERVERFFWHDFCDNYLELVKDMLFNPDGYNAEEVAATRWTLYTVGLRVLQLYAPYVPYVTEAIYGTVYAKEGVPSIHLTQYADVQQLYVYPKSKKTIDAVVQIVSAVRKLKSEQQLSLKVPLASLTVVLADASIENALDKQRRLLQGVTRAEALDYKAGAAVEPLLEERDGQWHAVVFVGG